MVTVEQQQWYFWVHTTAAIKKGVLIYSEAVVAGDSTKPRLLLSLDKPASSLFLLQQQHKSRSTFAVQSLLAPCFSRLDCFSRLAPTDKQ